MDIPIACRQAIPRLIAATDLPGFGRVALSACIPVLSAMGIQTCPLPTAILSTHGAYSDPSFLELGANMRAMAAHWNQLGLKFDGLYSGFLGSLEQYELIMELAQRLRGEGAFVLVDPVLGDHGSLYGLFNPNHISSMQKLCAQADLITPNLTEAALLLGKEGNAEPSGEAELKDWLGRLSQLGPVQVVITSCSEPGVSGHTGVAAFDRDTGKFWRVQHSLVPTSYPGTGDVFASVLLGAILGGDNFPKALDRAVQFTSLAVSSSHSSGLDVREGLMLEQILDRLKYGITPSVLEF